MQGLCSRLDFRGLLTAYRFEHKIRYWFPVFIIMKYIPDLPKEPLHFEMHALSTSAGLEYQLANSREFDAKVIEYDYTDTWPETLWTKAQAWEPKFYMLGPLYYMAMKLESRNEMNAVRKQYCERFNIQRITDANSTITQKAGKTASTLYQVASVFIS